jgi:hypothetical protein
MLHFWSVAPPYVAMLPSNGNICNALGLSWSELNWRMFTYWLFVC